MRIVLTNDDGIDAPGITELRAVVTALKPKADVRVVAPDGPRSGIGHAVAHTGDHVRVDRRAENRLAIDGTPADCVRIALCRGGPFETRSGGPPPDTDWVLAGINHGANLGTDTFVSGTAAAAREAALRGCPAIALSQYVARHRHIDWKAAHARAARVLTALLEEPPEPGAYWNVNLPHPADENVHAEWIRCDVDPSPLPVHFERRGDGYENRANYHGRARRRGHDVDVCMGGQISVSLVRPT